MGKVETGRVREHGSGIWDVLDAGEAVLADFDSAAFKHVLPGTDVYFVRMSDAPTTCSNVQPILLVDHRVDSLASPTNGYNKAAELRVRCFIMKKLFQAMNLEEEERDAKLAEIDATMARIKAAAEATRLRKVTSVLLASMGIS